MWGWNECMWKAHTFLSLAIIIINAICYGTNLLLKSWHKGKNTMLTCWKKCIASSRHNFKLCLSLTVSTLNLLLPPSKIFRFHVKEMGFFKHKIISEDMDIVLPWSVVDRTSSFFTVSQVTLSIHRTLVSLTKTW